MKNGGVTSKALAAPMDWMKIFSSSSCSPSAVMLKAGGGEREGKARKMEGWRMTQHPGEGKTDDFQSFALSLSLSLIPLSRSGRGKTLFFFPNS